MYKRRILVYGKGMKATDAVPPIPWAWPDKYGLGTVEIGGGKFLPRPKGISTSSVRRAVLQHAKRKGKVFVCRAVAEEGVEGVRVWRVS